MSKKTKKEKKNKAKIIIKSEKTLDELKENSLKDRFSGFYKTKKRFIN